MKKLNKLLDRCKCGVHLTVNLHRNDYQTAEDALKEKEGNLGYDLEISTKIRTVMIETNTIVELQFYPDTPVGSYSIFHYDIDKALDEALECLDL